MINIIDGNIRIDVYFSNDRIYTLSNVDYVDLDYYLSFIKTDDPITFFNNGKDIILNKDDNKRSNKRKFNFGRLLIVLSFTTLVTANTLINANEKVVNTNIDDIPIEDYNKSDICSLIKSSRYLDESEKDFLYNDDFFEDVLQIINDNNYMKYMYSIFFNNVKIERYDDNDRSDNTVGYYNLIRPNVLHVKNYDELNDFNKDTVAHEFIHLCQETNGYNLIIEASADILSNEYYGAPTSSYYTQVRLLKKLMEIIGTNPIMIYNFTGDFSLIEDRVKPYLSEEEYNEFLDDLTFDYDDDSLNYTKYESLDRLLSKLYTAIYGSNIEDNKVMDLIDNGDRTLNRYYFNSKLKSNERTYYLNYDEYVCHTISLEYAFENGLIQVYSIVKTPVEKEQAIGMALSGSYSIERDIDYDSRNVVLTNTTLKDNKMYISGIINGQRIEDYDVDSMKYDNFINVNYYVVAANKLSTEEYLSCKDDDSRSLKIFKSNSIQMDGDTIYYYTPKEEVLPLVNELFVTSKSL